MFNFCASFQIHCWIGAVFKLGKHLVLHTTLLNRWCFNFNVHTLLYKVSKYTLVVFVVSFYHAADATFIHRNCKFSFVTGMPSDNIHIYHVSRYGDTSFMYMFCFTLSFCRSDYVYDLLNEVIELVYIHIHAYAYGQLF